MRRSICFCEPSLALAGEINNWTFIYTTATTLPKGARLKFDLGSEGRPIDWQSPHTNLKKNENVIYALVGKGKVLSGEEVEIPGKWTQAYEFILPTEVHAGSEVTFVIGAPKGKEKERRKLGNRAQASAQRRRPFYLSIDPTGKGHYQEPEVFTIDIRGNKLHTIKVITPSFVAKNRRFDVIVRFEDEFGNLTNDTEDENTLIELSYENLRENLSWKLFIPETGFITLPNLYFNEAGVYTIKLKNMSNGQVFRSSPIKCFSDPHEALYWGSLHGESERVDSTENIETCLRHFRDEKAYDFYAISPFENQEETSNEEWKLITQNVFEFEEEDRFNTFAGFQWVGAPKEEGVRQIIFSKETKHLPRKKDVKYSTLKKLYKSFAPKEIISIPTFTMGKGYEYNFANYSPEFERVVEIYNAWGSSECSAKENNPCPIQSPNKTGVQESIEGNIQKALLRNCRFGFVAGGLDDRGIYADFFESGQVQYPPGLTAIIAKAHTREALAEALYNRSCYATTGERIIVGLFIAGVSMGKEISTATKAGLFVNRHVSGYVAGTTTLSKVELIRNGVTIHTMTADGYILDFAYDDLDPIEKIAIKSKDKTPPFVYYYLRVTQEDGHMAWSSPIWIDVLPPAKPEPRRSSLKPVKKLVVEEELEEEEVLDDYDLDEDDDEDEE